MYENLLNTVARLGSTHSQDETRYVADVRSSAPPQHSHSSLVQHKPLAMAKAKNILRQFAFARWMMVYFFRALDRALCQSTARTLTVVLLFGDRFPCGLSLLPASPLSFFY